MYSKFSHLPPEVLEAFTQRGLLPSPCHFLTQDQLDAFLELCEGFTKPEKALVVVIKIEENSLATYYGTTSSVSDRLKMAIAMDAVTIL